MHSQTLAYFFERDLLKLKEELNLYKNEADLWVVKKDISNSAGNLCLHLIGNLNHFIGATLGNSGYVRTREVEFSAKDVPREKLLADIDAVAGIVKTTIGSLTADDFAKDFPLRMQDRVVTTQQMLLHLLMHLSYHLGQINYHRRLITTG